MCCFFPLLFERFRNLWQSCDTFFFSFRFLFLTWQSKTAVKIGLRSEKFFIRSSAYVRITCRRDCRYFRDDCFLFSSLYSVRIGVKSNDVFKRKHAITRIRIKEKHYIYIYLYTNSRGKVLLTKIRFRLGRVFIILRLSVIINFPNAFITIHAYTYNNFEFFLYIDFRRVF